MKRWLYLVHRWFGIALCLVMALWFLSGIVMLYVGYPKLTDEERWQGLPALRAEGCCVPLAQALQAAGLAGGDGAAAAAMGWRLTSVAGEPTFIFNDGTKLAVAVGARSGERVQGAGVLDALRAARHFAGEASAQYVGTVQEDAWTHSRAIDAHRPLHRIAVDDAQSRWLYISSHTGEVVRDATLTERRWGWIGAWLHWLYIFRGGALNPWWTDIVIGLALAGGVLSIAGMAVGILRWRWCRPYRNGRRTPYGGFVARWHHWLGLGGGALAVTWVISGLLSMNPWKVFDSGGVKPDRLAYAGGSLQAAQAPEAAAALAQLRSHGVAVKELEWRRVGGTHVVLAHGAGITQVLDAQGLRDEGLPASLWQAAARTLLPRARIVEAQQLADFDRYYVTREPHTMTGHRERPLPVWRLRFDDPNETWVTIDPRTGGILQIIDGHRRVERWLFGFLHSFDLPLLLRSRPPWDIGMVGFSLAGLGLSLTGVVTGWRRLRRRSGSRMPYRGVRAT
ncbi:MAG: PepSY domain-containing protein [Burkholderiaceae bacterium]|nr:PepSY domain-containing protein [Burkholderiaceae bacterium]